MATSGCFDGKKEKNCFVWPERKAGGECGTPWWAACCQNWRKFHRIRSQGWIMEIGKSLEKKLTCKRDFSNILPTVLRLMLKDPFKQSVRTRWRSGIHSGPLGGWWVGLGHFSNWRNIKWMVIIIVNKNSKEKLLGNFFQSWLQTCLPRRTFHHTFVNQFISVRFPPHLDRSQSLF